LFSPQNHGCHRKLQITGTVFHLHGAADAVILSSTSSEYDARSSDFSVTNGQISDD
jgi:hypothetical protein